MKANLIALAEGIRDAEQAEVYAQMHFGIQAQVAAMQKTHNLKFAFALVTDTAVGGSHFFIKLERAMKGMK